MEGGCSRKDEACPQLLDLISKDREWMIKRGEGRSHGSPEEKKLELRLGPPGEDWTIMENSNCRERDESLLYLRYLSSMASMTHNSNSNNNNNKKNNNNIINNNNTTPCGKRGFLETMEMNTGGEEGWMMNNSNGNQNQKQAANNNNSNNNNNGVLGSPWSSSSPGYQVKTQQQTKASFLQFQSNPSVIAKESSQPCSTKVVDLQNTEKKAFSPASANTAVPNSSQKRSAPTAVVGWPPIRSFRKNLASSSSSKQATESQDVVPDKTTGEKPAEISNKKGLFVKINMDGVPIGRKVDLKAYDSYEKLSSAVDELFRCLLAAQRDSSAGGIQNKQEEEKTITGLLDGSGEYTLVYEDNEGDRVLVGDVPWHMFVSTVKRLRVLKSSELSAISLGSSKQGKVVTHDSALK